MASLSQAERLELPSGELRPLPPLAAVRAFEAAVRLQSFSRAAREMHMSPAAVSYQIKQLERRLGLVLFQRLARKVVLTHAGEQLAPAVLDAFRTLQGAFSTVTERAVGELAITTLPTFVSSWLIPRLGRFSKLQPDLRLRTDTSVPLVDLELGAFDISIRTGSGEWPGMRSHFLLPDLYTPLLSPTLSASVGGVRLPEDLRRLPLLGRASVWRNWLVQSGTDAFDPTIRTRMDFGIEQYDVVAAVAGEGVAIASPLFFAREIERGDLIQPFPLSVKASGGYWIAYLQSSESAPKIVALTRWLMAEAQAVPGMRAAPTSSAEQLDGTPTGPAPRPPART